MLWWSHGRAWDVLDRGTALAYGVYPHDLHISTDICDKKRPSSAASVVLWYRASSVLGEKSRHLSASTRGMMSTRRHATNLRVCSMPS